MMERDSSESRKDATKNSKTPYQTKANNPHSLKWQTNPKDKAIGVQKQMVHAFCSIFAHHIPLRKKTMRNFYSLNCNPNMSDHLC